MLLNIVMNFMGTQTSGFVERDRSRRQPAQLPASLSSLSLSESRGRGFFSLRFKCCPLPLLHPQAQIPYLFIQLYLDPFFSEVCSEKDQQFRNSRTERSVADSLVLILVLLKQNMHFKQDAWVCCFDYTIAGMMLLISSHMVDMFLLAASFIPIPYP